MNEYQKADVETALYGSSVMRVTDTGVHLLSEQERYILGLCGKMRPVLADKERREEERIANMIKEFTEEC